MSATKLKIKEAVEILPVSESTLRRDRKTGKVSATKTPQGCWVFDIAELQRVYGQLKPIKPEQENELFNDSQANNNDKVVAILEEQVSDLKNQLELSMSEKADLMKEKSRLFDLLEKEKDEKRALMPPAEEQKPKPRNWLLRLISA